MATPRPSDGIQGDYHSSQDLKLQVSTSLSQGSESAPPYLKDLSQHLPISRIWASTSLSQGSESAPPYLKDLSQHLPISRIWVSTSLSQGSESAPPYLKDLSQHLPTSKIRFKRMSAASHVPLLLENWTSQGRERKLGIVDSPHLAPGCSRLCLLPFMTVTPWPHLNRVLKETSHQLWLSGQFVVLITLT